jgi:hypothetical protein
VSWSPIVELRQYTLHPGKRDVLVDLFEADLAGANLIEGQEATGMKVIGQFCDLDDPNKFVWVRGFPTMSEREQSLTEFYGGPVWDANREVANGAMVDSDDVLLMRPARADSAFTLDGERPPPGAAGGTDRGIVEATILSLGAPADDELVAFFEDEIAPHIARAGASVLAYLVTEASENTFPSLPVREGEAVFVWFGGFADGAAYEAASRERTEAVDAARRSPGLALPPNVLRLAPTPRSQLTGSSPACPALPGGP